VLEVLEERMRLGGGNALAITLRLEIRGAPRWVDVTIWPPHGFVCSEPRYESAVIALLEMLGLLLPGAEADDPWTYLPFRHPLWRYEALFGPVITAALIARRVLVWGDSRQMSDEEARAIYRVAVTFPIDEEPGMHYVLSRDACFTPRKVGPEKRRVLDLSLPALGALLLERLGLPGPVRQWPGSYVLDLGAVPSPSGVALRFFAVVGAPLGGRDRVELARALRDAARGEQVVLLVPPGRTLGADVLELQLDLFGIEPAPEIVQAARAKTSLDAAPTAGVAVAALGPRARKKSVPAPVIVQSGLVFDALRVGRRTSLLVHNERRTIQDAKVAPLLRLIIAHELDPESYVSRQELGIARVPGATTDIREALRGLLPPGVELLEPDGHSGLRLNPSVHIERIDWDRLLHHPNQEVRTLVEAHLKGRAGRRA
jgi:hypothetical protein